MIEVKELACPICGANLSDTASGCSYCGAKVILSDDRTKFHLVGTLCPKCGENNKDTYRYCSKCGASLIRRCPSCGTDMPTNAVHCPKCGMSEEEYNQERTSEEALNREIVSAEGRLAFFESSRARSWGIVLFAIAVLLYILIITGSGPGKEAKEAAFDPAILGLSVFGIPGFFLLYYHYVVRPRKIKRIESEIARKTNVLASLKESGAENKT
jgi:uncharacterized membrane protein YvbJ